VATASVADPRYLFLGIRTATSLRQKKRNSKAAPELHLDRLIRAGDGDANSICLPAKPAYGHNDNNNNDVEEARCDRRRGMNDRIEMGIVESSRSED